MVDEDRFQGRDHIAHGVPAISDLDRMRSTLPNALALRLGTVAADNLDGGMRRQPVRNRLARPIRQQIKHDRTLTINDDRPVGSAFVEGLVIDTNHRRWWRSWIGSTLNIAQQRRSTDRSERGMTGRGTEDATQHQAQLLLERLETGRAAGKWRHNGGPPGQIGQGAGIAAMNAGAGCLAARTGGRRWHQGGHERHGRRRRGPPQFVDDQIIGR